ncbi:MAG TPA: glycosyltransferase [Methylomirabilota bacterium]|nr:glycosyltransferase [Methylomirabilota bacterium]
MRTCLFDDMIGGHHGSYLFGLSRAAIQASQNLVIASPLEPDTNEADWFRVPVGERSAVLRGRRSLRAVTSTCRDQGVDLFVDLNLDKNIWLIPRSLEQINRRFHVLHQTHQYRFEGRTASGRIRTLALRTILRRLADRGAQVVVHTPRAFATLQAILPRESIVKLGYPIRPVMAADESDSGETEPSRPSVLFVGQARHEKGLSDLLEAASRLPEAAIIRIVGQQRPDVRQELSSRFTAVPVEWIDRFVSEAELENQYRAASLIATPYRTSFGRDGGASGVLLETLAHGKPALTTETLRDQLPAEYGGAVVVPAEDITAISEGLSRALHTLPAFTKASSKEGPAFIGRNHTFESYVARLAGETSVK